MPPFRPRLHLRRPATRLYTTTVPTAPPPRHLLTIADLTPTELTTLVLNAQSHKHTRKATGALPAPLGTSLLGRQVGLLFSKRSTRTRVSTEGAVAALGGHALFLGRDDGQLGASESARDTALVLGRMMAAVVARVGAHADVEELARWAGVPVVNALSDRFHPMQAVADLLTVREAFAARAPARAAGPGLGLEGLKISWCGDPSNVFVDLAIGALKLGVDVAVATPAAYALPKSTRDFITAAAADAPRPGALIETTVPEEAVKDADVLVTDTWVSMGEERQAAERMRAFEGFQITSELAKRGGAKEGWRFMHCLPRHPPGEGEVSEVSDEVFYGPRSVVFDEAENRLWAAISVLEAFVVNKGEIL
jgi:ornithine carbamoyltransferase